MNRKYKKMNFIGIFIILLLFGITIVFIFLNGDLRHSLERTQEHNKDLKSYNEKIQLKNDELNKKIESLTENIEKKDCNFIKTYKIVKILNDYVDDINYFYIVADQFQGLSPFVLKLPQEYRSLIVEGKYYEFYFISNTFYKNFLENYSIQKIELTEKVGLYQIQEICE